MLIERTKHHGFTLIELLLVVAIIALLSGIVLVIINPSMVFEKTRDSRRLTDIALIMSAVERYHIDVGSYPDDASILRRSNLLPEDQSGPLQSADEGWIKAHLSKYIYKLPVDPSNENDYIYRYIHNSDGYEIDTKLEYYENKSLEDAGNNDFRFEVGSDLTLLP